MRLEQRCNPLLMLVSPMFELHGSRLLDSEIAPRRRQLVQQLLLFALQCATKRFDFLG
jgi:hypothetical protein